MPTDAWAWWIGAASALVGGVLALWPERGRGARPRFVAHAHWALLAAALVAAMAGLGWRAWMAGVWPGVTPPDALALLAGGGLVVAAWSAAGASAHGRPLLRAALGVTLLGAAVILGAAAASAPMWPAASLPLPPSAWLLGLRNLLASIGLGGWLPVLATSLVWYRQAVTGALAPPSAAPTGEAERPEVPPPALAVPVLVRPAEDFGRSAALFSQPWLTAACLVGGAWNVVAYVALNRAAAADLWLVAAWLLAAAYLLVTSSWRPLRLPGWLALLLAAATLAAGLLAASTAGILR